MALGIKVNQPFVPRAVLLIHSDCVNFCLFPSNLFTFASTLPTPSNRKLLDTRNCGVLLANANGVTGQDIKNYAQVKFWTAAPYIYCPSLMKEKISTALGP